MEQTTLYPAIVAVGYNRPDSMQRLLDSVGRAAYPNNAQVTLVVSIDECNRSAEVAAVAEAFHWPHGEKIIRRFPARQGLRRHVLQCGDLSETYGAVIVLEDDLMVAPGYYEYVVQALAFYADAPEIAGIALYSHAWNGYANVEFRPAQNGFDAYLGQYSISWGQCWTSAQWRAFRASYDAHQAAPLPYIDAVPWAVTHWPDTSWGKYFVYYIVESGRYYVVPYASLSTNFSDAGQHAAARDTAHQVPLLLGTGKPYRFPAIAEAVRYDIYFERMGLELPGFSEGGVCANLSGIKPSAMGCRYLLTMRALPYETAASYGLSMRPAEANALCAVPGDDIFLYDTEKPLSKPARAENPSVRLRYELYGHDWRVLLRFSFREFLRRGCGRIRRLFGGRT